METTNVNPASNKEGKKNKGEAVRNAAKYAGAAAVGAAAVVGVEAWPKPEPEPNPEQDANLDSNGHTAHGGGGQQSPAKVEEITELDVNDIKIDPNEVIVDPERPELADNGPTPITTETVVDPAHPEIAYVDVDGPVDIEVVTEEILAQGLPEVQPAEILPEDVLPEDPGFLAVEEDIAPADDIHVADDLIG